MFTLDFTKFVSNVSILIFQEVIFIRVLYFSFLLIIYSLLCNDGGMITFMWSWYSRNVEYVHVHLFEIPQCLMDYLYLVEYYLTPSGRLVDRLPICMNEQTACRIEFLCFVLLVSCLRIDEQNRKCTVLPM